jgi:hypothetical protein
MFVLEPTFPVRAVSSTGRCNTIQSFDSTTLARAKHLLGCTRSKPSQGSAPAGLTLASDFSFCFQCRAGPSLVLHPPIETTALIRTCSASCPTSLDVLTSHLVWASSHEDGSLLFVIQWLSIRPYLYFGFLSIRHDFRLVGYQFIFFCNRFDFQDFPATGFLLQPGSYLC